jgi:hypothetical protein
MPCNAAATNAHALPVDPGLGVKHLISFRLINGNDALGGPPSQRKRVLAQGNQRQLFLVLTHRPSDKDRKHGNPIQQELQLRACEKARLFSSYSEAAHHESNVRIHSQAELPQRPRQKAMTRAIAAVNAILTSQCQSPGVPEGWIRSAIASSVISAFKRVTSRQPVPPGTTTGASGRAKCPQ